MSDPWEHFAAEQIAEAGACPIDAIRDNWPRLAEQLGHCKINDRPTQVAMIGTVTIETARRFQPINEFRNADGSIPSYWLNYDGGPTFHGRGFIQLTHRSNYAKYGPKVAELWGTSPNQPDFDLVGNPDQALNADISAAVAALYFRDHGGDGQARIPKAAAAGDWTEVRRLVQGGSAGLDRLVQIANALTAPAVPVELSTDGYVFPVEGYAGPIELHWGTFAGASDIFAPRGTAVRAIHSGTVVYREQFGALGGNAVQISGDDGLQSYYAHGDRVPQVAYDQRVKAGAFLFGVGDTGNAKAAGPHLHFGMGKEIMTGSGAQGGAGSDFDAVAFLRRLQAAQQSAKPDQSQPASIRELLDRLEVSRASLDDFGAAPADPPEGTKKDGLWATVRNYQAWRDAVHANIGRAYAEIGEIGAELRKHQEG